MAKIQIVVRHTGVGWHVVTNGKTRQTVGKAQPYASRDEAISDALFSARMLDALGEDVEVMLESRDGMRPVGEPEERVWLRH